MTEIPPVDRRADPLSPVLRRYLLSGDPTAMEEVVSRTRPRLLAAARRIGRPEDAEDAVQAAYLSLVRKKGADLPAPVLPWLLTATVREAYRRKAVHTRESRLAGLLAKEPAADGGPLADAMDAEEAARIRDDLARLPARYRDPVVLRYFQGLSTAEIALLLGITDAAVRVRLHRARALLLPRWTSRFALGVMAIPSGLPHLGKWSSLQSRVVTGGVMGKGGVAAAVALIAAAGVLAGATVFAPSAPPPPDLDALRRETAQPLQAEIDRLRTEVQADRSSLRAERQRADAAEAKAAELANAAGAAKRQAGGPAAVSAPASDRDPASRPRFTFAEHGPVLAEVDWSAVGTHLSAIPPLMRAFADASMAKKPPDLEMAGRLLKARSGLTSAVARFADALHGKGEFDGFAHPAFLANAIAAGLDAAKLPLDASQSSSLEKLAADYSGRDTRRLAGYDAATWSLQREIDEAALKDGFSESAFALLAQEQRDALCLTRNLVSLDPFSSGAMWAKSFHAVTFSEKDDLADRMTALVAKELGAPESLHANLRTVVLRWVDALPEGWLTAEPFFVYGQPIVDVAQMTQAAALQIKLLQEAAPVVGSPDAAARATRVTAVYIPIHER